MEHSEKPQHLDQSNKVFWQRACNWTKDFSVSSKRELISFCPNNPHQTARNHMPYVWIKFSQLKTPTIHQAFHRAWHGPLCSKDMKHINPQRVSYRTMEEKMIHNFLILMAHTTPIHQNALPKHKIIQCKDLPMNRCPHKKCHPPRDLSFPNTLPRKIGSSCTPNDIVIGLGIKHAIPFETPMRSVIPITPRDPRLNELKEREGSP